MKPRSNLLRLALAVYKHTLSPIFAWCGGGCRFLPSCSEYLVEAIETHGWLHGAWLGLCRVCRCHPWGGCGYDPVPSSDRAHHTCPHCK